MFIHVPQLGYIDVADIVQVFNPNGGEVSLDDAPEIAVRFSSPVFNGHSTTDVFKITDKDTIEFIIAALGLLSCPHSMADLQKRDPLNLSGLGIPKNPLQEKK